MSDKARIEVHVARPPTRKCRELLAIMEEAVRRYPERLRLVVYERGAPWPEEPSPRFRLALMKCRLVPLYMLSGMDLPCAEMPTLDGVMVRLQEALGSEPGPSHWTAMER